MHTSHCGLTNDLAAHFLSSNIAAVWISLSCGYTFHCIMTFANIVVTSLCRDIMHELIPASPPPFFYFSSGQMESLGTRLGNSRLWRCWWCLVGWSLQEPAELPSSLQPSRLLLGDATSAQSRSPGLLQLQTHKDDIYILLSGEDIK